MKKRWNFTLRNKLLFFLAFFTTIPIIAFSYWTLEVLNTHAEETRLANLRGLAKTKAQAIETFGNDRISSVEKLAAMADVVGSLKALTAAAGNAKEVPSSENLKALEKKGGGLPQSVDEKREEESGARAPESVSSEKPVEPVEQVKPKVNAAISHLKKILKVVLSDQKEYEEVLIISPEAVVIASTFDGHEGKTAKGIEYFEKGLRTTFFQHVFVSSITEKLTMVISTPIKDETGNVLAVLAARLNLKVFFKVIEDLAGLGKTGETIVAKKLDEEIVFMGPTRHEHKAALVTRVKIGSSQLKGLQEATRGGSGAGVVVDYRGTVCLAAWEYISGLDWGLMVKLDRDEAREPYLQTQSKTIMFSFVLFLIGVLLSLLVATALVKPLKELEHVAERISKGDLNVKLSLSSRDEIGELADSFGRMIASIKFLLDDEKGMDRR